MRPLAILAAIGIYVSILAYISYVGASFANNLNKSMIDNMKDIQGYEDR